MWINPNEFYAIMRCTNVKFANKLVDNGSIKFNTPESWVREEVKTGKGRGDRLEGVFAACDLLDLESVIAYSQKYNDVVGETIDGLTYFRRKRTMSLPCYCFFLLKQGLFECPSKKGKQKIKTTIPGLYFKDFADNLSNESIMNLTEEEKPAIVLISDPDKFISIIKQKLISLGIKDTEIMVEIMEYQDLKTSFYCKSDSPKELKLKDKYFSYQAEGRIIINTNNNLIKEYLNNNPIEIGDLLDIAQLNQVYLKDGALVEMNVDIYESLG